MSKNNYSDYIIYVNESGDHSLEFLDKEYPVFVLAFCIFNKKSYTQSAVTKLKDFKFKHFGHDMIVLHENEIRRDKGVFKTLRPKSKKNAFIEELTSIIEEENFVEIIQGRLMMLGLKYTHKSKKALTSPSELSADRESAIQYSNDNIIIPMEKYNAKK